MLKQIIQLYNSLSICDRENIVSPHGLSIMELLKKNNNLSTYSIFFNATIVKERNTINYEIISFFVFNNSFNVKNTLLS